ncbi:MAG: phosphoribosylanthranilate isomerase [Magnetococcales bacterium]|nr:phosphoribosylanthranilate isomerase [Magnetococcales bacterium]
MTRIKMCGITRLQDAQAALEAGADAIGLVFYEKSKRCIDPEKARNIVRELPPFLSVVGLFVNEALEEIHRIASLVGLDIIQLHGDESPEMCQAVERRVIKALRIADGEDLAGIASFIPDNGLLLDAKVAGSYGGTGHRFDWSLLKDGQLPRHYVLAGGLNPDNVAEAVRQVAPYGVDVSSGVEVSPGIKDSAKMAQFVRRVRAAETEC